MTIRASIDIGSNSMLLLLAEVKNGEISILENESYVTGLGRDLDKNGEFLEVAMQDSYEVFKKYYSLCLKHKMDTSKVVVTATEASRVSKNSKSFFEKIKNEFGFHVQIISGEAEAYYSTTGILFDNRITESEITIMDIGGASTELIKVDVKNKKILESFSMPVGAVRLTDWSLEKKRDEKFNKVLNEFLSQLNKVKTEKLYCVAGTMTSVGNMFLNNKSFVEDEVNGLEFSTIEIDKMIKKYSDFSPEAFLEHYPFLGKRSNTILSGLILSRTILERLEAKNVYISTYGLRYGTLLAGEIKNDFLYRQ